ncbi:MAG: polysaccharide biosynthesis tyrosine autokinase, partial [Flavicella sp.]
KIVLDRNRVLRTSTEDNPLVRNYEAQLTNLRNSLDQSLQNLQSSLGITLDELNKQDSKFNSKLVSIPRKEREYRDIVRQQGIKESLYLYLLQKEEETQISLAVTTSNSKVIDKAYGSSIPVAPKGGIILLAGLLVGLLIPFVYIYLNDLLDTKFHNRQDLEKIVTAPILGDIPISNSNEHIVVKEGERSSAAEAFRLIRTNLDFILSDSEINCKSIFVTSSTSGEGKSFVSVNLATTLALSGKKVALIGMDLRAPKITAYLNVVNKSGVTNFIKDSKLTLDDMKFNLEGHPTLDVYSSGAIPPNPAELLLHSRVTELFDNLKSNYDYLVVDTAPVNLVTDTLMISKHADMFVYVARANFIDKRLLEIPQKLYIEKRLPKLSILINGSDPRSSYGYGSYGAYGYGEQTTKKSWLKNLFTS